MQSQAREPERGGRSRKKAEEIGVQLSYLGFKSLLLLIKKFKGNVQGLSGFGVHL